MRTLLLSCLLAAPAAAGLPAKHARALSEEDGSALKSAFKGKAVLLEFWTTTCGPCQEAKPFFEDLQKRYAERGVIVLSVNAGEDPSTVRNWLKAHPTSLRVVYDRDGKAEAALGLFGQPAVALFDASQRLNLAGAGLSEMTKKDLAGRIEFMAPGPPGSVPVGKLK